MNVIELIENGQKIGLTMQLG